MARGEIEPLECNEIAKLIEKYNEINIFYIEFEDSYPMFFNDP